MKVDLLIYTVQELAYDYGLPVEEVLEMYGEDAVKLYFTRVGNNDGVLAGVLFKDESCAVYGCRRDREGLTFGQMLEILVDEFAGMQ